MHNISGKMNDNIEFKNLNEFNEQLQQKVAYMLFSLDGYPTN